MDIGSLVGIILALALICVAIIMGGGSVGSMIDPGSIMIVFGGTFGATLVCFPLARVLKIHSVVMKAFFTKPVDPASIVQELVQYAEVARREGILALENMTDEMGDEFIVRGIKMAVDGTALS